MPPSYILAPLWQAAEIPTASRTSLYGQRWTRNGGRVDTTPASAIAYLV